MSKTITFNELRRIKDRLPDGSTLRIASELGLSVEEVRSYFGGGVGATCGLHIEPGPGGGIVLLSDTRILECALGILGESSSLSH
jgi:hypothetical protein